MEINKEYILELSRGLFELQESEKRKLEFKRQWYNLTDRIGIEEFCKDVAAMANTPGPDGFIVIGLDEDDGTLMNSPISDCGLPDVSLITNLIIKKVRPSIQFEIDTVTLEEEGNKVISVIKIPPSLDKPHVIGRYKTQQNYIPIRNGTDIFPANHTDLEYMFYDRKNVIPDYRIALLPIHQDLVVNTSQESGDRVLTTNIKFILQNVGRYPIAISNATLKIFDTTPTVSDQKDTFNFIGISWLLFENNNVGPIDYPLLNRPMVVPFNSIYHVRMTFSSIDETFNLNPPNFDHRVRKFREVQNFKYVITVSSINNRSFTTGVWENK